MTPRELVGLGLTPAYTNEQYHSLPGVSKSGLDRFAVSPAHYQAYLKEPKKDTPAMRFGRLVHGAILEPEACRVMIAPAVDRRTKAGKQAWAEAEQECAASGCEFVTEAEADQIMYMRDAVYSNPIARELLFHDGVAERSAWWIDAESGELCKCRPDYLRSDGVMVDLKTTESAHPRRMEISAAKYRYHVQAAFYADGASNHAPVTHFVILAVEKSPPHIVQTCVFSREDFNAGREIYKQQLLRLARCKAANVWPGYSEKIETLTLPPWALETEEDEAA